MARCEIFELHSSDSLSSGSTRRLLSSSHAQIAFLRECFYLLRVPQLWPHRNTCPAGEINSEDDEQEHRYRDGDGPAGSHRAFGKGEEPFGEAIPKVTCFIAYAIGFDMLYGVNCKCIPEVVSFRRKPTCALKK